MAGAVAIGARDWVVLEQPDGFQRLVQLKPGSTIDLSKYGKIQADSLFGRTYEGTFEIRDGGQLAQLPDRVEATEDSLSGRLLPNDCIFDDNTSQRLSHDDIARLKGELEPQQLIETVIANSASFERKNAFAQVKYRRRKESKFERWVRVRRCTSCALVGYYAMRDAQRIGFLRQDALSQMLCRGNVFEGQRVMVLDETRGLLLGAIADLNRSGMNIPVCDGDHFQPFIYEHFNLPESLLFPLSTRFLWNRDESLPEPLSNSTAKFLEKHERTRQAIEKARHKEIDSLMVVLVSKKLDVGLFEAMLSALRPSSPVVIFAPFLEFLVDLFDSMFRDHRFVDVHLAEPWMREYQTAAGRSHPMMSMSGHGGYILSAYHVLPL